jgi:hypothetical protein
MIVNIELPKNQCKRGDDLENDFSVKKIIKNDSMIISS